MKNKIQFDTSLIPYLGRTAKYAGFYFIDAFQEHGIDLSKEQWLVLKKLYEKDGQIQNDLAFITNRSKTSLTRLINTMEKKGLVFRSTSKNDKRINHIHLSELGKRTFSKSIPVIEILINELQSGIDQKELECAIEVLNKVQNNINKKLNTF